MPNKKLSGPMLCHTSLSKILPRTIYNLHITIENISNTSGLCLLITILVRTTCMYNVTVHVTNENISNTSDLYLLIAIYVQCTYML